MIKDTTMIEMTNIDNQPMDQIHIQIVITWDTAMTATAMTATAMTATAMTATAMTATAMTATAMTATAMTATAMTATAMTATAMTATALEWLHMINKVMIAVMTKDHTVTIVTTKPRIKNMNVKQVHLKDSLPVQ